VTIICCCAKAPVFYCCYLSS